jgi:hypothetical protein
MEKQTSNEAQQAYLICSAPEPWTNLGYWGTGLNPTPSLRRIVTQAFIIFSAPIRRSRRRCRAPRRSPPTSTLLGIGPTLSFGQSSGSNNAPTIYVPRLVSGVTRGRFEGDPQKHGERLESYDVKQVEVDLSRIITE